MPKWLASTSTFSAWWEGWSRQARQADRARERDHLAYDIRMTPSEFTGEDAAETPADHAHRSVVARAELVQAFGQIADDSRSGSDVAPEFPAVGRVSERAEEAAEYHRGHVAGPQGGE